MSNLATFELVTDLAANGANVEVVKGGVFGTNPTGFDTRWENTLSTSTANTRETGYATDYDIQIYRRK